MNKIKNISAVLLIMALPVVPAAAQDDSPIASESQVSEPEVTLKSDVLAVVTSLDENGNETTTLTKPTEYTPGTKLNFGMNYANSGSEAVTNVTGTNPLNAAVRLAPDADPALIVSVDGGGTFDQLAKLSVPTESGNPRAATHADVTHVRWTIASIAAGESGRIGFPVIIR